MKVTTGKKNFLNVIIKLYCNSDCVLGEIRVIHVQHLLWRAVLLITHLFSAWLLFS